MLPHHFRAVRQAAFFLVAFLSMAFFLNCDMMAHEAVEIHAHGDLAREVLDHL